MKMSKMFIEVWNSSFSASILGFGSAAIADKNPCYLLYIRDYTLPSYMGVSKNRDTPKWMVYNGKPY